jgi:hypothetical protein
MPTRGVKRLSCARSDQNFLIPLFVYIEFFVCLVRIVIGASALMDITAYSAADE